RAFARGPGARAEGRQVPPAQRRRGARGAREDQVRRHVVRKTIVIASTLAAVLATSALAEESKESTEGLDMQAARARMMKARGEKIAYTKKFDLSELPHYQPAAKVSGTIRMWGSNYITDGFLGGYWESEFRKYHPDVKFDFRMKTTLAAVPSLIF